MVSSVALTLVIAMSLALPLRREGRMHTFTRAVLILPFALIGAGCRFVSNPGFGVLATWIGAVFPALEGTPWLADPDLAMAILLPTDVWHRAP